MATLEEFFAGQVFWVTSNPRISNFPSGELQLEAFYIIIIFIVRHTNHCLK